MNVSFAKLSPKRQIRLPKAVLNAVGLEEGDPVAIEVTDDGAILLRPQKTVDATQAWFLGATWQEGEAAASADIAAGRTTIHTSDGDLLAALGE